VSSRRRKARKRRAKNRHRKVVPGNAASMKKGPNGPALPGKGALTLLALAVAGLMGLACGELLRLSYVVSAALPGLVAFALRGVVVLLGFALIHHAADNASRRWRFSFERIGLAFQLMILGFVVVFFGRDGGLRQAREMEKAPPLQIALAELAQHPEARFVTLDDAEVRPDIHVELSQSDPSDESEEWFTATGITGEMWQPGEPVPLWVLRSGKGAIARELPVPIRGVVKEMGLVQGRLRAAGYGLVDPVRHIRASEGGYDETLRGYRAHGERWRRYLQLGVAGMCLLLGWARVWS
jgi:hypothetical protein